MEKTTKPVVYDHFNRPPKQVTVNDKPSRTKQEHAESTDIYNMLNRFQKTGEIRTNGVQPMYGDFSQIGDYRQAREMLAETEENFLKLPSKIRDRFQNDPAKLIDFVADNKNREEAIKLGLIEVSDPPPKPLSAEDIAKAIKDSNNPESKQK